MNIEQLLIRAGESGLNELVSNSLLEILYEFENQPTIQRLAKVIVEIYGEQIYIHEPQKRRILFQVIHVQANSAQRMSVFPSLELIES